MDLLTFSLAIITAVPAPKAAPTTADLAQPAQVRKALERSLTFLEKDGVAWMKERKCAACHVVTFMVWSHNEAKRHGIDVDQAKLDEWTKWTLDFCVAERSKTGAATGGGLDTMAQIILARNGGAYVADEKSTEALQTLSQLIVQMQQKEGFWKAGGQLPDQRRPGRETDEVSTAWTVLALLSVEKPSDAVLESLERARAWLKNVRPGKSTESLLVYLLLERFCETGPAKGYLQELFDRQNADGGWGWLTGEASDAFATGQTLYALSFAGLAKDHPAIRRAQAYLVKTQRADGAWFVPTTKSKKNEKPIMATYWGTAWAAIGLARTLPK